MINCVKGRKEPLKHLGKQCNVNKVSVEEAITTFNSETRAGPDFVCTCCHRMMYRKTLQCSIAPRVSHFSALVVSGATIQGLSGPGTPW